LKAQEGLEVGVLGETTFSASDPTRQDLGGGRGALTVVKVGGAGYARRSERDSLANDPLLLVYNLEPCGTIRVDVADDEEPR
jgi:hypothetical protein